jgi:hypothetical protein
MPGLQVKRCEELPVEVMETEELRLKAGCYWGIRSKQGTTNNAP